MTPGLEDTIVDRDAYERNVEHLHERGVVLPKISQLADPVGQLSDRMEALNAADPDAADPLNLFRVHWHNGDDRKSLADVPEHLVLGEDLTGVKAKIVVALGNRFPMIDCHKVLAAYGCLIPRLMSGVFDATRHRAVWPSTGNYCRGGVAIANLLGCRSVAVLPEGMSQERFDWLNAWLADPNDIYRTPGTESNVKEIYDACYDLAKSPENLILNQFAEYGNYIIHRAVTGPAMERIFNHLNKFGTLKPRAFVSATGSAGTIAAGDYLKASLGAQIGAIEALECPTMLYNGYGEHNIQGIGDKHVPLIQNVMNADFVIGVSDRASDGLNLVCNTTAGRSYLSNYRGLRQEDITDLGNLGLSSLANIVGAIKYAKYMDLGSDDVVLTVATDGAKMYQTELGIAERKFYPAGFDAVRAAEAYGRSILGATTDHMIEMTRPDHERVFNLGYYTWVEQQGTTLEDFDRRRDQAFWDGLLDLVPVWDDMIEAFNR
ncbi:pyridoxal-phosphate dependent enzyme [Actibacterium pelagium]|uniref:Pyridoxal-5'-phosphate-dependent protein subunit beta n=1 Tax=Actibacterium pelagium TaxID=2029103 RepID=A0A917ALY2_9RHOB|nr:pyridoxal-phosphate dependent enzyme [Actibacterium pelagium]GGE61292.1 pyridoxal-5'-phosphate-dependent protein subunit beta [Actibacterium pelagium]